MIVVPSTAVRAATFQKLDILDELARTSPEFHGFLLASSVEYGQAAEVGGFSRNGEVREFLGTMCFFLRVIRSVNGQRLPEIPDDDFRVRIEQTASMSVIQAEFMKRFALRESEEFMVELMMRLNKLLLYTRSHTIMILSIVMDALEQSLDLKPGCFAP